jgi:hypothetical protein
MNIEIEIPVVIRATLHTDSVDMTDEQLEEWTADYASVVANAVAANTGARLVNAGHVEYCDDDSAVYLDDDFECEYHGEDFRILGS